MSAFAVLWDVSDLYSITLQFNRDSEGKNKSDGEVHLDGVSSRAESTSYKQLEIRQT